MHLGTTKVNRSLYADDLVLLSQSRSGLQESLAKLPKLCSIEFESYLSQVKIVKHRQAVTRFRISAHRLPIETGRYAHIEHNLRLCPICNSNETGDEYHYFS